MRISTSQIFDAGARGIGSNQYDLFKLQNQLSTGRKVLTPEDDPIAAAQALVLTQTQSVSSQFLKNQDDASGKLGIVDNQLTALNDLLQNVRERVVQAGSTTLTNADRSYVAQELEARFSELLGIANSQDGAGNYLFSGYQGAVKPYSVTSTGAAYAGDEGKRLLQVDGSRQIPTNISGGELFENIRNGNGAIATATGGNVSSSALGNAGGANLGTGLISSVSVTDQVLWDQTQASKAGNIEIRFTASATPGQVEYALYDASVSPASALTDPAAYVSPQTIQLETTSPPSPSAMDFGASVTISGAPSVGDSFAIKYGRINQGSAIIDQGSITNQAQWNTSLANSALWSPGYEGEMEIRFVVDASGVTNYELYAKGILAAVDGPTAFIPGQSIPLVNTGVDLGVSVTIEGVPSNGDSFDVSPSTNQSIFETLRSTISLLQKGIGSVASGNSTTEYSNTLASSLQNIDQALENVTKARTTVGSHLKELDSLNNTGQDLQLQYASSLSGLQDLDWAKAITDMSRKQMQLEAAQLSFKQTSQLSLFSIL